MMTANNTSYQIANREFIASRQANVFQPLKQMQFSGQLLLTDAEKKQWIFYFYLGRIMYATGGIHPVRRWKRNVAAYFPQINTELNKLKTSGFKNIGQEVCWEYDLLCLFVEEKQITREQNTKIIQGIVTEIFFDLNQAMQVKSKFKINKSVATPLTLIDSEQMIIDGWKEWQHWRGAKLADRSPNSAPLITQLELLKRRCSEKNFQAMSKLLDGKKTLRDLSAQTKINLQQLTASIMPYVQEGLVELLEIPDITNPFAPTNKKSSNTNIQKAIIACIDDSPQFCQRMEKIITLAGYEFVGITESLRAIGILLDKKPDLIFLDLVMPFTNGYEICNQLRKISVFRDTPIIILTGNEGIIDRVRAKIVGSTDFLNKPASPKIVHETIKKYLKNTSDNLT